MLCKCFSWTEGILMRREDFVMLTTDGVAQGTTHGWTALSAAPSVPKLLEVWNARSY
jgi:hypothetical protein